VVKVDESACLACGKCAENCAFGALSVNGPSKVDREKCMGCGGVCARRCPNDAVTLIRDERKEVPLDVRVLA
jgi:electron transfer flavoprotein alpha subunit